MVAKYSKILLFILFLFVGFNVFAQEVDVTGNCYGSTGYARMYDGTEVSYNNSSLFSFGTTYQYQLSSFQTDLHYNFQPNTWYLISFIAADNDFRNNFAIWAAYDLDNNMNNIVYGFSFIDKRKVLISFTTTTATTKVRLVLGSSNRTIPITGEVNWNIQSVILDDPYYGQSGSGGSGGSGGTTSDNQDIINNANQNTQDIIESNKVCTYYDKDNITFDDHFLNSNNALVSNSAFGLTDYLKISSNDTIKILNVLTGSSSPSYCFYRANKSNISCHLLSTLNQGDVLDIPENAYFIRFSLNKSYNLPTFQICKNGNQGLEDTITDDNVDSDTGADFFSSFSTSDNGGISAIVTKPLTLVNALLDSNNSCANLPLPSFMGADNVTLPSGCILWNAAPTLVVNLWNIFITGFGSYYVLKQLFLLVENLKSPNNDKVEVLDL